ncbi:MAG: hypothetical protein HRT81_01375 [Henriciella sp.]|nr:hypothetical protein [Henriciella sp.]
MRLFFICFVICLAPSAFADGWKLYSGQMELDVRGSVGLDQNYAFLSVRTTDPNAPEVRFSCSDQHGLKSTIIFEPMVSRTSHGGSIRYKARRSSLAIEGRKVEHVMWTHVRETRTIQNRQMKTARMLFNAVIKNADFVVKEPLGDKIAIDLPPVDDAFTYFAKSCHVTNGSS